MYLLSEYHGRKIGITMMDDALSSARVLGFSDMILETNARLDKVIKLYKKY